MSFRADVRAPVATSTLRLPAGPVPPSPWPFSPREAARPTGPQEQPRAASALQPGDRIGRFRLHGKLGQGASSVVFAAHDERDGRGVALKIPRFGADPVLMQRFVREGRVGAAVRHPNLVEVLELVVAPEHPFIVMELVRGQTLRAKIQAAGGRGLPLETVLQIARRVCRGLSRAHDASIVHRDIKPGNVMIDHAGEVKLLDFGIAKLHPHAAWSLAGNGGQPLARLTGAGDILGTPGYMAPEQARGGEIDARADVFSVGVMLYEMLTGMRPFHGGSTLELLFAVERECPPPPVTKHSPHPCSLRPLINHVVLRCLEKVPDRRYTDAGKLLQDVCALSRLVREAEPPP